MCTFAIPNPKIERGNTLSYHTSVYVKYIITMYTFLSVSGGLFILVPGSVECFVCFSNSLNQFSFNRPNILKY